MNHVIQSLSSADISIFHRKPLLYQENKDIDGILMHNF